MDLFFFSTVGGFYIEAFIVFLVVNFLLVYGFCSILFSTRRPTSSKINKVEIYALRKFTVTLFKIWVIGFCINVAASGGLPVFWVMMGDVRTYSNFGVPTFSGLLNMIRMFMVVAIMICAVNKAPTPKYISLILIFSFIAELNRASILFALLGAVGAFLLFNKLRVINFLRIGLVAILFVMSFGFIAEFREIGRGGYVSPADYFNVDVAKFGAIMYVLLYYATPLNNLYHQFSLGIEPTYTPYFTLQSLLPTVVRDLFFTGETVYSVEFVSDAFNTSPYIANIISDFGLVGAAMVVSIIQFLCCYVFIRAARSSLEHCLLASVLWGATTLSVFTNLYFTLIVVAFPLLITIFSRYKRRYIKFYETASP
jgi:oligosaccharide repeat unit polymerase